MQVNNVCIGTGQRFQKKNKIKKKKRNVTLIASYIGLRPRRDRKGVGTNYDRYLDNGISGASEKQTASGRNKANTTGRDQR